jgi:hypothetical protein
MKSIILILTLVAPFAQAKSLDIKAGLWQVNMSMKGADGKETIPASAISAALEKVPEAQRKQMMEMMGEMNPMMSNKGIKACYTEAMIKDPKSMAKYDEGECETTITSQTSKEIKSNFKCQDGARGTAVWKFQSPTSFEGTFNVNSPELGEVTMVHKGKFLSKDCGDVKPLGEKS